MKLTNFFKMATDRKLTLPEWLVYSFICAYSNGKVSHITIRSLMDLTGIKKPDTITKHTNKLQEEGLITKKYIFRGDGKKLVEYHITPINSNFICISNELLNTLKTNEIAFAIRLASLRLYGSNKVLLTNNEIISKLGIGKSTFYRYINTLIEKKVVIKVDNGYLINPDLFFVFKTKTEKAKELETGLLKTIGNGSLYSKIFENAYTSNYEGINNIEKFLEWCMAGCPGLNKKNTSNNVNEFNF